VQVAEIEIDPMQLDAERAAVQEQIDAKASLCRRIGGTLNERSAIAGFDAAIAGIKRALAMA
jgi:hypothetical protein